MANYQPQFNVGEKIEAFKTIEPANPEKWKGAPREWRHATIIRGPDEYFHLEPQYEAYMVEFVCGGQYVYNVASIRPVVHIKPLQP